MAEAPLHGIRVLDLSRVLAGPWAGQTLADLGADVIKIERPGSGDDTRHWGPPWLRDRAGRETATAAYYLAANRGKRSVTVDLANAGGQSVIRDLAAVSDVLIENFRVGSLARHGLDYDRLAALNPRLVYCSITGFGQTGPQRHTPGYDLLIQAMGGLMSVTGAADGPPQKVGVAIADICTGLYATIAIQGALLERGRSGRGQQIDLALLDTQVAVLANQAANYLVGGSVPQRLGNAHPNIAPYEVFAAADGHLVIAVGNDAQFRALAAALERPGLAADERFASNGARVRHRAALRAAIDEALAERSRDAWLARLQAANVPAGPINNIAEAFDLEQVKDRQMRQSLAHPEAGTLYLPANPIRYGRSAIAAGPAPPALGADTDAVLAEILGYEAQRIGQLRRDGAI